MASELDALKRERDALRVQAGSERARKAARGGRSVRRSHGGYLLVGPRTYQLVPTSVPNQLTVLENANKTRINGANES